MSDNNSHSKDTGILWEIIALFIICMIVFVFSTLQVDEILSIWNQNDEFGVWQGAAWILGLDWSEVVSTNNYYGYGYGFILALFIRFFGEDSVLMTHMAIYFQAFMHTSCIFIAWYCIRKMFPTVDAVTRIIGASVCILTIPDLFYVYMFFSECLLRFIVWITFGLVVSHACNRKWYKMLLINVVAIWGFTVHQRCILLVGLAAMLFLFETFVSIKKYGVRAHATVMLVIVAIGSILFYIIGYICAQESYISMLYHAGGESNLGGNLLSERGYTIKSILKNVVFNREVEQIALQNMFGMAYYICASDCGFTFYGFIMCFYKIKNLISRKDNNLVLPYVYMGGMTLIGIFLVVYQNANEGAYSRVEVMHYGRYCSYLFAPMVMLGIMFVLTESTVKLRKSVQVVSGSLLIAGIVTYNVLKSHNVTNLFAFANACPGITSVYYTENPFTATLYHTALGIIWILFPAVILIFFDKHLVKKRYVQIGIFVCISVMWLYIANREWQETHNGQNAYVTQTYDLQNILKNTDEFAAFKSYGRYGSGLLQYNNMFSKLHIIQSLDELGEDENGLLVVSQKGIDEMDEIVQRYSIEYENERYFVWRYKMEP